MRKPAALITALATLAAFPAMAQSCPSGSSLALAVIDWSVAEADSLGLTSARVAVTLRNNLDVGFRLIDGSVRFSDVLGANHGNIEIDRASNADAGGTFEIGGVYSGRTILKVTEMHRDDVIVTACTNAIVTIDGETITNPLPTDASVPMDVSNIDAARQAMMRCWNPPMAALSAGISVTLRVKLEPNGSLAGTPEIASEIASDLERATALSAQRAVQQCGPYTFLPEASHESWQELTMTFNAAEL